MSQGEKLPQELSYFRKALKPMGVEDFLAETRRAEQVDYIWMVEKAETEIESFLAMSQIDPEVDNTCLDVFYAETGSPEIPVWVLGKEIAWEKNVAMITHLYEKYDVEMELVQRIKEAPSDINEGQYVYELIRLAPEKGIAFGEYYTFYDDQREAVEDFTDAPDIFGLNVYLLKDGQLPDYLQEELD